MKFSFYTLGCKVNQYETQAMEQQLQALGHEIGDFQSPCDGYIINTCTVTAVADKKNRAVIRRCRRLNPEAIVAVCGCYAQVNPADIRALGVDVLGGSGQRQEFIAMLLQAARERRSMERVDDSMRRRTFEVLPAGGLEARTRAMLKVQDGCSNFCSYCIIPYARGPVRSETLADAVEQTRALAAAGYREIVVTGIEIASWGQDLPGKPGLSQLIAAICQASPEVRIRLGSLEPRIVDETFCALNRLANLCPQFHLSLQSGSDSVLRRMRRKYDTGRYLESVRMLHQAFPGCAITTDIIVGFPGETEEEFTQTLEFAEQCAFAAAHVFPYSRRPGTPASKMPGQITRQEKERRSARLMETAGRLEQRYLENLVGTAQAVLFEEPAGAYFTGHAPNYARVYAMGEALHNQLRTVRITGLYEDGLLGEIVEAPEQTAAGVVQAEDKKILEKI